MAGASTNRFGGNALLAGGILYAVAVYLHPDYSTLEHANGANPQMWIAVHLTFLLADLCLVTGFVTLFRQVTGAGSNAGWGAAALAGGVMGFMLDAVGTGIHAYSFPPVLPASTANLQNIFDAGVAVSVGIDNAGALLANVGLLLLGVVLNKEGWSAVVAYGAMIIGVLGVVSGTSSLITSSTVLLALSLLMPVWYAYVGFSFAKVEAK
jgi:hypothetical protein